MLAALVSIGVLTLFQPRELILETPSIEIGGERLTLREPVRVRAEGRVLTVRVGNRQLRGGLLTGKGPRVRISIPDRIDRSYTGSFKIAVTEGILYPVIYMDLEDAVARVVAAEMPSAALEAQKAQAIAARSYYAAPARTHTFFDFCDTTHCQAQFEQERRPAADATRGQTLRYQGKVLRALYFRSCGGRTHTAAEIGFRDEAYRYEAVICEACRRNPRTWTRKLPAGAKPPRSEKERLGLGRAFGWESFPSNTYELKNGQVHGVGEGHGVGLCQRGAADLARQGWDAVSILRHYYPGADAAHGGH
jgi:stage II sporulation protein D